MSDVPKQGERSVSALSPDGTDRPESVRIGPLMDEFVGRFRRGERPSVTEYAERHPELANEIRELFPSLVLMERAGSGHDELPSGTVTADGRALEQLGDYRILREIGRGGMGIVYEAEQESLGRRVALKVLPHYALVDPKHIKRFHREARAAAQLHHTNIVPVFGVGEHDGLHFYAMQFIQGLGLDEVMVELKRLRRKLAGEKTPNAEPHGVHPLGASVASGFLSGELPAVPPAVQADSFDREQEACARAESLAPSAAAARAHASGLRSNEGMHEERNSKDDSSGSLVLPGDSEAASSATSQPHYFRSVARLGVQVADALAYAHAQGVLHRDIKPSNLLLDTKGTVWVTDFGLAKTGGDDLTHSGDIVGTLRYMAPERFRGWSDARSDIYSLGLTLHEMLTLRPAFDATDRAKLVKQVTQEDPPRPRRIDRDVPRDLETVVLKATAKEPYARYQSAAELADDLRRFVAGEPIVARRTPTRERIMLWCRRNPLVASLTGLVAALLLILAVGSSIAAFHLNERRVTALDNLGRATKAEGNEREARELATRRLFDAYLAQALAGRWSGLAGRRFDSLEAAAKANRDGATGFDLFFLAMSHQRLGEVAKAHEHFDKALDWWRHQKDLPADWPEELKRFCMEAAALLAIEELQHAPRR